VDATNVQFESRAPLLALAREHRVPTVAIVFDIPERVCLERCSARPERHVAAHVIRSQLLSLSGTIDHLQLEGFDDVHLLDQETVERVEVNRGSA
jgi:protein phosphatase